MATPYITPDMIQRAPTGVPWDVVPWPQTTEPDQVAELTNICWRSTNLIDSTYCNQPLRATLSVEQIQGPDYRLTVDSSGVARAMTSRWPVTEVLGGRVSPRAAIPRSWSTIPVAAMTPETPPITGLGSTVEGASGAGDQAVLIAPGYVGWYAGRNGYTVELAYLNGWPHAGLAADATAGASTLAVDDVTGFVGASAFIYDGAATETVNVLAVAATAPVTLPTGGIVHTGPGVLTLAAPLTADHAAGIVCSALPQDISWAAALLGAAQVLDEGATSVTIQNVAGSQTTGGKGIQELVDQAARILQPYARVI